VLKIEGEKWNFEPSDINPEDNLVEDLTADSLDIVEIVMGIEEEFDIDIEDREAEKLHTVQDIVSLIETKKGV
jgi:acyl carrier protein